MPYQLLATMPNGEQKSIFNLDEEGALRRVAEFVDDNTLTYRWGNQARSRQALELRIVHTDSRYSTRNSGPFLEFIKGKRNAFKRLAKKVEEQREATRQRIRVFVVMPIQGHRFGTQSEQTVLATYDDRFEKIEEVLAGFGCTAIRIDREQTIGGLVDRIKQEIRRSRFVIADLTDERPSCYFEFGFAEALGRPVIPIASKESVVHPGEQTKIHFDIHQNVRFFTNHDEMASELQEAIERNRAQLVDPLPEPSNPFFISASSDHVRQLSLTLPSVANVIPTTLGSVTLD